MFKKTWNEINNFKRQKDEDERTNCGALYWLLETKSDLEALEKWLYSAEIIALVAQEFPVSYHFVLTSASYWTLTEL